MITATRYHDFSAGHRVAGHETKCKHLHGHNYRVFFTITADDLDPVGRVLDFGVIKTLLCNWLEDNWDHKMLIWKQDPKREPLQREFNSDIYLTTFNPTAENMAKYLVEHVGPMVLIGTGTVLKKVVVEETRKCSAAYEKI